MRPYCSPREIATDQSLVLRAFAVQPFVQHHLFKPLHSQLHQDARNAQSPCSSITALSDLAPPLPSPTPFLLASTPDSAVASALALRLLCPHGPDLHLHIRPLPFHHIPPAFHLWLSIRSLINSQTGGTMKTTKTTTPILMVRNRPNSSSLQCRVALPAAAVTVVTVVAAAAAAAAAVTTIILNLMAPIQINTSLLRLLLCTQPPSNETPFEQRPFLQPYWLLSETW